MTDRITFRPQPETFLLSFGGPDGKMMLGLRADGTTVMGENFQPDEAAKQLLMAIEAQLNAMRVVQREPVDWVKYNPAPGMEYRQRQEPPKVLREYPTDTRTKRDQIAALPTVHLVSPAAVGEYIRRESVLTILDAPKPKNEGKDT